MLPLKSTRALDLSQTAIGDGGLKTLAGAQQIRALDISTTKITDDGLAYFKDYKEKGPIELKIKDTAITDRGLQVLADTGHPFSQLDLDGTQITDAGLVHLQRIPKLTSYVGLSNTSITDEGIDALSQLKKVRQINLTATKVTAQGVARLKAALPKCQIKSDFSDQRIEATME